MSCVICPILPCGLTYSVGIWFVFNFETCLSPVLITPPCVFKPPVSPGSSLARLLLIICTCLIYPDPCTLLRHLAASSVWAGWSWWDFRKLRPLFRGSLPKWRKPLGVRRIWFWRILRGMLLWNRREQQVGNIHYASLFWVCAFDFEWVIHFNWNVFSWPPLLLQGSPYWRQNARKVLAVPEKDFTDLQGTKRRRMR